MKPLLTVSNKTSTFRGLSRRRGAASALRARCLPTGGAKGAILLEVLIALTIFVMAAAVVGSAMRSSIDAVTDIRLSTKAANIARSVLAELSIGMLEMTETGPEPFVLDEEAEPPEEGWTYEVAAEDMPDMPGLKIVTVTVTNADARRPHTCRLTQWMLDRNFGSTALESEGFEEMMP